MGWFDVRMHAFRIHFSNFSQSNTVCTSDLLKWSDARVCVSSKSQKPISLNGSNL